MQRTLRDAIGGAQIVSVQYYVSGRWLVVLPDSADTPVSTPPRTVQCCEHHAGVLRAWRERWPNESAEGYRERVLSYVRQCCSTRNA